MLLLAGLPLTYQNSIGHLYEHPAGYVIIDYQPGIRERSDYQAFLHQLERLLQRRGWHKMLANQRRMAPFADVERTWLYEQWRTLSQTLQQEMVAAVLLPEDVFARLTMSTLMQGARAGALRYRIFTEAPAAAAWLDQVP
jgi:hypothetical protein